MLIAKIISLLITLISTAYIARHLGPKNYGELSYAISFVSLFSFIASLGIDQVLHREIIRTPEKKDELLGSAIVLRIISSLFTILITTFSAFLISPKDVSLLLIFILSTTFIFGSFQLLSYEFQAESKSKYPSILSLAVLIILNILKILTVFLDGGVIYLAGIILLEPILYSLGYIYLKNTFYRNIFLLSYKKDTIISLLKDSFPLIFASAFFLIYARIDQVMLKNMIDSKAVGLYDSAVRISELSYFLPQILLTSLFPAIINAKKISEEIYYKRLKKLLFFLILLSITIAFFTTLLAKHILLIIFGGAFITALPALYICIWSILGSSLSTFTQQILLTENLTKFISIATFFGMIINIILNSILIPKYGISGAAIATLISYMVPFISLFLYAKTRKIILSIITS
ncbi:MAG: flippase [Candidatus Pacebacteria bacterium]|nr:flippase [Candidatus Paceibacterota bacterium]